MSYQTRQPFAQFFDLKGKPLEGGFIYFGEVNKNPQTDPIMVYSDDGLTQPVAQPLRTTGGYVSLHGKPIQVFTADTAMSVACYDSDRGLVFYLPEAAGGESLLQLIADLADTSDPSKGATLVGRAIGQFGTYAAVRALTSSMTADQIYVGGRSNVFDGAHGMFQYDATDTTSSDNDGTILVDAAGRRWKRQFYRKVNVLWFGAVGDWDGVSSGTDNTEPFQNAADFVSPDLTKQTEFYSLMIPNGHYKITDEIVFRGEVDIQGESSTWGNEARIVQVTADKHIFVIYGDKEFIVNGGFRIDKVCFAHSSAAVTLAGYAIYAPAIEPVSGLEIFSNSIYITNCKYGTGGIQGNFIRIEKGDDIRVFGSTVDNCAGRAVYLGTYGTYETTNVRITDNGFYSCGKCIKFEGVKQATITANNFLFYNGTNSVNNACIDMTAPSAGGENNTAIVISSNTFDRTVYSITADGKSKGLNVVGNTFLNPLSAVFKITNTYAATGMHFTANEVVVGAGFASPFVIESDAAVVTSSKVSGNAFTVPSALNAVIGGIVADKNLWQCDTRDNLYNSASPPNVSCYVGANSSSVKNFIGYPASQGMFALSKLASGDTLTLEVAYTINCTQSGVDTTITTGVLDINMLKVGTGYANTINKRFENGQSGGGISGNIPTTTFAIDTAGSIEVIRATVSGPLVTPSVTIVSEILSVRNAPQVTMLVA